MKLQFVTFVPKKHPRPTRVIINARISMKAFTVNDGAMSKIAVVTAITGGMDSLKEYQKEDNVDFIAFTDKDLESKTWIIKPAYDKFKSNRRNSRLHKILLHQFVTAEYSMWLDGNIRLNVPVSKVIDEWLKDYDMAVFKHPERNCVYDEGRVCMQINKENEIDALTEQGEAYHKSGYPEQNGLYSAGILLRKHNSVVEMFNNFWWSEFCRHSTRDQISFPYCVSKFNIKLNVIVGDMPKTFENRWGHPYFSYSLHEK